MKPFQIRTGIQEYDDFAAFAEAYQPGEKDLILTNEYIYQPFMEALSLPCIRVFQERYGAGEPTDVMVDAILQDLENKEYDRIIAVGGGTIIDIAKVLCVAASGERMDDLYGKMPALQKHHPLLIVPTTCGTGSEVTNISVISRVSRGVKQGLVSEAMYADEAILIAGMLNTLPYQVFATSSIDAMIHAAESFLSPNACPASELFSAEALRIIVSSWLQALQQGGGDAWKQKGAAYLRAANYAGIAFGYAGCAAVHALSYPVGSVHHVPHGQSNQLMFADVMRKYQQLKPVGKLNELETLLAGILHTDPVFAIARLCEVMEEILPKGSLKEHGVTPEELPVFADSVLKTQQRLLGNNYTPLTYDDILDIYRHAY
jgi:4-hydroxybutyrate dehydrogenase